MNWILIGILGLVAGSFLNCLAYRLPRAEKILLARSRCPRCQKILSWLELIPILSFIIQKARCRSCRQKISWQYPLVEIITALLFLFVLLKISNFQFPISNQVLMSNIQYLIFNIFVVCVLMVIFLTDLNFGIISDWIVWPSLLVIFICQLLFGLSWWRLGLAMVMAGSFFGLQYLASRGRWIGAGDIGLGILLGAILGWPNILAALALAYIGGAAVALALVVFKKKTWNSTVPLGVFLIPAAFIVMMWEEWLLKIIFNI